MLHPASRDRTTLLLGRILTVSRWSGVSGLELGDEAGGDTATLADLDALGLGPGPDRLGVIPSGLSSRCRAAGAAAAGAPAPAPVRRAAATYLAKVSRVANGSVVR